MIREFLVLAIGISPWLLPFSSASSQKSSTALAGMKTYPLPRVHIQFICHQNIVESGFNVIAMFDSFYTDIIPGVSKISLRHHQRSSSMRDVAPDKWYYNRCNISSPEVLLTMQTEGFAMYDMTQKDYNETDPFQLEPHAFNDFIMEQVTPDSLQTYIETNVCNDTELYRAVVEESAHTAIASFDEDPYLEHSTILLCGGESYIYYQEGDAEDGGFFLFGMLVGVVMVSMIGGELQLLYNRPLPSRGSGNTGTTGNSTRTRVSRPRDRQRVDYALAPAEIEMV